MYVRSSDQLSIGAPPPPPPISFAQRPQYRQYFGGRTSFVYEHQTKLTRPLTPSGGLQTRSTNTVGRYRFCFSKGGRGGGGLPALGSQGEAGAGLTRCPTCHRSIVGICFSGFAPKVGAMCQQVFDYLRWVSGAPSVEGWDQLLAVALALLQQ